MYQATNIMTPDDLNKNANEIQAFLESVFNADNPAACVDRAQALSVYLALSGKMVADAKWHHNQLLQSEIMKTVNGSMADKMTASTMNLFIKSLAKDYQYLVDWIDRLNSGCTHQLDILRSIISKLKEEAKQMQWQK